MMKQVVQNYKTGQLKVEDIPVPLPREKSLLIKTEASLISAGTEQSKIETARMNMVEKAISRLDLVKVLLNNIKQEGLVFTLQKAFNKLDASISLGYSCSGRVMESGPGMGEYKTGDKVACVGEGSASHAEINAAPEHFVVPVPSNVDCEEASFVGLGAIALNSIELAQLKDDEVVGVIGLGLIGQIVLQILKARGLRVCGIEIDADKLSLAERFGLDVKLNPLTDDVEGRVRDFTSGRGLDAVIITAASKNNLPVEIAGKISRYKGRVILVGAMPIIIPRKEYYEKELYFVVSSGFGSGLYHPLDKSRRYPYNYMTRLPRENMRTFLSLISERKVDVKSLITHRFKLKDAQKAYALISQKKEKYVGVVFRYNGAVLDEIKPFSRLQNKKGHLGTGIGFIGAGSFAQGYILPLLKKTKTANLIGVSNASGINAKNVARKFGFSYATADYNDILNDPKVNCVFILTRHDLHAKFVIAALEKNKSVFVEKPLCVNEDELRQIISAYQKPNTPALTAGRQHPTSNLMVGYNRRFSPFVAKIKGFFNHRISPLVIYYRVNAGYLSDSHWVHTSEGAGRIIGEVCHFVDLLSYIASAKPIEVSAVSLSCPNKGVSSEDNVVITLKLSDGSVGTINYNSVGDISYPRERIEIFGDNSVVILDNFNKLSLSRCGHIKNFRLSSRDMGHRLEIKSFTESLLNGSQPLIPFDELVLTALTTFKIEEALRRNCAVGVDLKGWIEE